MEKYRTVDNLKIVKNEKKRKKIQKKLRGAVRFLILKNILRVKYDICIFPLLNNIQYYSESKFTRYINGSKIISSEDIVDYFLELNFIKKFGCTNDLCVWKNDTHRCLLFTLLMNKDVCINILPLSFKKKAKLLADIYPERFERKEKLIKKFEEYNILGRFDKCYYKFYDYIYNSDGNIDQIVDSEVISEFIDNNIPEEYCNDYVSNTTILQEWFFDIKTKISENTLNKILCSSPIQVRKILEKYC
ncbi:MAG TPA: hypothetical protein V6C58_05735 [Allocoleopsis sp.]